MSEPNGNGWWKWVAGVVLASQASLNGLIAVWLIAQAQDVSAVKARMECIEQKGK
jgi:hypothetical protein